MPHESVCGCCQLLGDRQLRNSLAGPQIKAPFIFARDFHANFSTKWMAKDVGMALEQGKLLNVPLPITAVTEQMFLASVSEGRGDDDFCAVIQILEDWAGVVVKK